MVDEERDHSAIPPSKPARPRLNTPGGVLRELARLYIDFRNGRVTDKEAGTGGFLLNVMLRAHEVKALDCLPALEKQIALGARQRELRVVGRA